MKKIEISVTGNEAVVTQSQLLVAGTVGQPVTFTFDGVWNGLEKTVVFRVGDRVFHRIEPESTVTVPWELLVQPGVTLWAGAWGVSQDGSMQIPTVWVSLGQILPGTQAEGEQEHDPSLPVWQQVYNALDGKVEKAVQSAMPEMVAAVLAALPDGDEVAY